MLLYLGLIHYATLVFTYNFLTHKLLHKLVLQIVRDTH